MEGRTRNEWQSHLLVAEGAGFPLKLRRKDFYPTMPGQSVTWGSGEEPNKIYSHQLSVLSEVQRAAIPEFTWAHSSMFLLMLGPSVPVSGQMKILQTFSQKQHNLQGQKKGSLHCFLFEK